ncbi:hypothetical protein, partial [Paremcibacter congregatus]|uniref:hypothetical protein n=1 Tax=Paremcibacter congregatus TaxID=2043170 RepID=UPI0030EE5A8E
MIADRAQTILIRKTVARGQDLTLRRRSRDHHSPRRAVVDIADYSGRCGYAVFIGPLTIRITGLYRQDTPHISLSKKVSLPNFTRVIAVAVPVIADRA